MSESDGQECCGWGKAGERLGRSLREISDGSGRVIQEGVRVTVWRTALGLEGDVAGAVGTDGIGWGTEAPTTGQ